MKLADIRKAVEADPETLFADCQGDMVRPVQPFSHQYEIVPVYDDQGKPVINPATRQQEGKFEIVTNPGKEDPWATCTNGRNHRSQRDYAGYRKRGILVEVFRWDDEGKATKSRGKKLVRAADIGGLWNEYLLLHSEAVIAQAKKWAADEENARRNQELDARLKATGFEFPVGEVVFEEDGYQDAVSGSSFMKAESKTAYSARSIAKGAPAHSPLVSISARNDEDVDYLLEVLRLGVIHRASLAKRREREARQRETSRSEA